MTQGTITDDGCLLPVRNCSPPSVERGQLRKQIGPGSKARPDPLAHLRFC